MTNLFDDLLQSPRMFPDRFDFSDGTIHFCQMTPQTYSASPWLDNRKVSVDGMYYKLNIDSVLKRVSDNLPARQRSLYIFHTSHCCSTLLARCLNELKGYLSLKEPLVLRQLSELKRSAIFPQIEQSGQWKQLVELVTALLSRTFEPTDVALLKTTSICHNLIKEVLDDKTRTPGIFLYSGLQDYLISMYKEPNRLKIYLDTFYPLLRKDMDTLGLVPNIDLDNLSTPQQAALMWVARIKTFAKYASCKGDHYRLASLHCNLFLNNPADTLQQLCKFYGISAETDQIKAVASSPHLKQEAKYGQQEYNSRIRAIESDKVLQKHSREIDTAMQWAESLLPESNWLHKLPYGLDKAMSPAN